MAEILITGSEGFIGSHVIENLSRGDHNLTALVQYNSQGSLGWLDELVCDAPHKIKLGDVRDSGQMMDLTKDADCVIHMASLIAIPYSYEAPQAYVETNILGTLNVLNGARSAAVKRFIQTSTSEVYGTALRVPMTEGHPLQAQSPYSASKIGADALVQSYVDSFDLPAVTIRPFNTFGPRQSQRAVIPTLGAQFLAKSRQVRVGALKPTRDFTFVTDTARAFSLALTAPDIDGEVIHLGTGWEISVEGILDLLSDITGHRPAIEIDHSRIRPPSSEVERLVSDNTKAKRLLGWEPELFGETGFRRGLELTLEWLDSELAAGKINPDDYVR